MDENTGPSASDRLPGDSVAPGILVYYGDEPRIHIPARVTVGDSILVRIDTYGECGTRHSETLVSLDGSVTVIRPMDRTVEIPSNSMCILPLSLIEHKVVIPAVSSGRLKLRIVGREVPGNREVSLERTLTVK